MSESPELKLTLEEHDSAFTEVSFLLQIFAQTMKDLVGGGTATVARKAGSNQGKKLPIYEPKKEFEPVVKAVLEQMHAGFEVKAKFSDDEAELVFTRCAIRDVCRERKLEVGGELCKVYHTFFGGIVNELLGRQVRSQIQDASDKSCTASLEAS